MCARIFTFYFLCQGECPPGISALWLSPELLTNSFTVEKQQHQFTSPQGLVLVHLWFSFYH